MTSTKNRLVDDPRFSNFQKIGQEARSVNRLEWTIGPFQIIIYLNLKEVDCTYKNNFIDKAISFDNPDEAFHAVMTQWYRIVQFRSSMSKVL